MAIFLSELVDVLLDTESFFERVKPWSLKKPLAYFAFISFISLLINWVLVSYSITPAGLLPFQKLIEGSNSLLFSIPLIYFVSGFFFAAFYAVLITAILKKMGLPTPFSKVSKAAFYGFTPSMLTLWIPVLGLFLIIWSLYITAMGLSVYNGGGIKKNAKASIAGGIITSAIVLFFLLGIGFYLITLFGKDISLLWNILIQI